MNRLINYEFVTNVTMLMLQMTIMFNGYRMDSTWRTWHSIRCLVVSFCSTLFERSEQWQMIFILHKCAVMLIRLRVGLYINKILIKAGLGMEGMGWVIGSSMGNGIGMVFIMCKSRMGMGMTTWEWNKIGNTQNYYSRTSVIMTSCFYRVFSYNEE